MPDTKILRLLYKHLFSMTAQWLPQRFLSKYDTLHFQKMQTSTHIHEILSMQCPVFLSFSDPANMELLPDVACRSKRSRSGAKQSQQLTHADKDAKKRFNERLESLRQLLIPGSKDNLELISKPMEIAEEQCMRCTLRWVYHWDYNQWSLHACRFKDKILWC